VTSLEEITLRLIPIKDNIIGKFFNQKLANSASTHEKCSGKINKKLPKKKLPKSIII